MEVFMSLGRKSWEPPYRLQPIILMKIIGPTWTILLFIQLSFDYVSYHMDRNIKKFWKRTTLDTFLGIATCGLYVYYVNYKKINPFRSFSKLRTLLEIQSTLYYLPSLLQH
jgi:signal peptidase I